MSSTYFLCLFLSLLVSIVNAQSSKLFFWGFKQSLSNALPACQQLEIKVFPANETLNNSTQAVPPFYMHAYAPGQLPQTTLIGDDENNLKWTVSFPPDTQLLLNVVDSNSSSGGVPSQLFTTVRGLNTQCITDTIKTPPRDFTVTANVTDSLETCQPWGLTINGGVRPYTVSLLALNSPVVTNVTGGPVEDAFTYANRAEPGTKLLAAVSDLTGRWAFGTPIVETTGLTDTACPGVDSSFGFTEVLAKEATQRQEESKKRRDALLAGVLTPVCLLVVGAIGGFWWWYHKRRVERSLSSSSPSSAMDHHHHLHLSPSPFRSPERLNSSDSMDSDMERATSMMTETKQDGQVLSITSYLNGVATPATTTQRTITSPSYTVATTTSLGSPQQQHDVSSSSDGHQNERGSFNSQFSRPGFNSFPQRPIRGDSVRGSGSKAVEAGYAEDDNAATGSSNGHHHHESPFNVPIPRSSSPTGYGGRQLPIPQAPRSIPPAIEGHNNNSNGGGGGGGGDDEAVYQHMDGGMNSSALQELPPPYMADMGRSAGRI